MGGSRPPDKVTGWQQRTCSQSTGFPGCQSSGKTAANSLLPPPQRGAGPGPDHPRAAGARPGAPPGALQAEPRYEPSGLTATLPRVELAPGPPPVGSTPPSRQIPPLAAKIEPCFPCGKPSLFCLESPSALGGVWINTVTEIPQKAVGQARQNLPLACKHPEEGR